MKYTVERRVPDRYTVYRWCVCRGDQIICHRDRREDALAMAQAFNKSYPIHPAPPMPREHGETVYLRLRRFLSTDDVIKPEPGRVKQELYGER